MIIVAISYFTKGNLTMNFVPSPSCVVNEISPCEVVTMLLQCLIQVPYRCF